MYTNEHTFVDRSQYYSVEFAACQKCGFDVSFRQSRGFSEEKLKEKARQAKQINAEETEAEDFELILTPCLHRMNSLAVPNVSKSQISLSFLSDSMNGDMFGCSQAELNRVNWVDHHDLNRINQHEESTLRTEIIQDSYFKDSCRNNSKQPPQTAANGRRTLILLESVDKQHDPAHQTSQSQPFHRKRDENSGYLEDQMQYNHSMNHSNEGNITKKVNDNRKGYSNGSILSRLEERRNENKLNLLKQNRRMNSSEIAAAPVPFKGAKEGNSQATEMAFQQEQELKQSQQEFELINCSLQTQPAGVAVDKPLMSQNNKQSSDDSNKKRKLTNVSNPNGQAASNFPAGTDFTDPSPFVGKQRPQGKKPSNSNNFDFTSAAALSQQKRNQNLNATKRGSLLQTSYQSGKQSSGIGNKKLDYFDRIKIMAMVKPKLKRFFEEMTISGRTTGLTDTIRSYINDFSDYHTPIRSGLLLAIWKVFTKAFGWMQLSKLPLLNPESKVKILFNSLTVTYNCFFLFIISIQIFFDADFGSVGHLLHQIAIITWITEMFVEMNTAMYHHNIFITDRKLITKIYLKEYLFFEILPLIFEGRTHENIYINILIHLPLLLKIKGVMINLEKLEFYILQSLNKQHFFQLFKLIMQMLLLSHIVACLWNCILKVEEKVLDDSTTWAEASHIIDGTWWKTYLYAQYWAFTTMKNIGTVPNSEIELVFTSFCMVLSCIAFGYILNAIGSILADITKKEEEYKRDLNILNSFMKRKEIDLGLKRRMNISLKKFYEHQSKVNFMAEKEILGKLNTHLVDEVVESSSKKILSNFPFFYSLFSEQTLLKLYSIMEEIVLAPSQIVYDRSTCVDETSSVYLIVKGSVLYYAEESVAKHDEEFQPDSEMGSSSQSQQQNGGKRNKNMLNGSSGQQNAADFQSSLRHYHRHLRNQPNEHFRKKVKVLTKGQSFGILGFFTGRQHTLSVQSSGYSTVMKIERGKFLKILSENSSDFEKFMEIKDKLLFDNNFDDLSLFCYICQSTTHLSSDCSKVHFDKYSSYVILRHKVSCPQERKALHHARSIIRFPNSLENMHAVQEATQMFKEDNSELFLDESEIDLLGDDSIIAGAAVAALDETQSNYNNLLSHQLQQNPFADTVINMTPILKESRAHVSATAAIQSQFYQLNVGERDYTNMGNGKEQNEGDQDVGEGDSFALNYFKKNTSTQDIGALDKLHQIQKNRRKHRLSDFSEQDLQNQESNCNIQSEELIERRSSVHQAKDYPQQGLIVAGFVSSQRRSVMVPSPRKKKGDLFIDETQFDLRRQPSPQQQQQHQQVMSAFHHQANPVNSLIKNLAQSISSHLNASYSNQQQYHDQASNLNPLIDYSRFQNEGIDQQQDRLRSSLKKNRQNALNANYPVIGQPLSGQQLWSNRMKEEGHVSVSVGGMQAFSRCKTILYETDQQQLQHQQQQARGALVQGGGGIDQRDRVNLVSQQNQNLMQIIEFDNFIRSIDVMKNFRHYYPMYNCSDVIRRAQLNMQRMRRFRKKFKTSMFQNQETGRQQKRVKTSLFRSHANTMKA